MSEEERVQNRMADAPDVRALRDTSTKPSWWGRVARRIALWFPNSTTRTVLLALTIGIALAVGLRLAL